MKIFAVTAFGLLGLIVAAPSWAQSPDDNPVINTYRQGSAGLPDDNFMHNSYEQHGPGTPGDNFMQDMMSRRPSSNIYQDDRSMMSPRRNDIYQDDQNDQNDQ